IFDFSEKCLTALARFHQAQLQEGKLQERTPVLASECNELPKAEKWRRRHHVQICPCSADISGLGEFKIRDLNDEINNLLREKGDWEVRTIGVGPKMLDREGVRELFEREPAPAARKTRAELMKDIDADYYGSRDEADGALAQLEQEYEHQGEAKPTKHLCFCLLKLVMEGLLLSHLKKSFSIKPELVDSLFTSLAQSNMQYMQFRAKMSRMKILENKMSKSG
uniref:ISY1 splicing factor homolog n=1 Tax=Sinocyclocheilus grahami TaxID=75366 RepID=A0A672L4D3_SINGR